MLYRGARPSDDGFVRWASEIRWLREFLLFRPDLQIEDMIPLMKPIRHFPCVPNHTLDDQET